MAIPGLTSSLIFILAISSWPVLSSAFASGPIFIVPISSWPIFIPVIVSRSTAGVVFTMSLSLSFLSVGRPSGLHPGEATGMIDGEPLPALEHEALRRACVELVNDRCICRWGFTEILRDDDAWTRGGG